jgi:hypothetical protein
MKTRRTRPTMSGAPLSPLSVFWRNPLYFIIWSMVVVASIIIIILSYISVT